MRRPVALMVLVGLAACGGEAPPRVDAPPTPEAEVLPPVGTDDAVALRRGMMTYMADAARFVDCATGAAYAIAMEGGYLELERAYVGAQQGAGEPLLVSVEGRVALRPGMEGGDVPTLLVDRFVAAFPGMGCGEGPVDLPLEGTAWRLLEVVGGVPVPDGAEASLHLDPESARASGSTGCNRFQGSYELTGGRLRVGTPVLTRMACPEPLAALETDVLEVLRVTGSFRLAGDTLELLGEEGPVARFLGR